MCVIPYEPIFHMYIYITRWVWIISLTNTWIKGMDQGYGSPVGPGTGRMLSREIAYRRTSGPQLFFRTFSATVQIEGTTTHKRLTCQTLTNESSCNVWTSCKSQASRQRRKPRNTRRAHTARAQLRAQLAMLQTGQRKPSPFLGDCPCKSMWVMHPWINRLVVSIPKKRNMDIWCCM